MVPIGCVRVLAVSRIMAPDHCAGMTGCDCTIEAVGLGCLTVSVVRQVQTIHMRCQVCGRIRLAEASSLRPETHQANYCTYKYAREQKDRDPIREFCGFWHLVHTSLPSPSRTSSSVKRAKLSRIVS